MHCLHFGFLFLSLYLPCLSLLSQRFFSFKRSRLASPRLASVSSTTISLPCAVSLSCSLCSHTSDFLLLPFSPPSLTLVTLSSRTHRLRRLLCRLSSRLTRLRLPVSSLAFFKFSLSVLLPVASLPIATPLNLCHVSLLSGKQTPLFSHTPTMCVHFSYTLVMRSVTSVASP